MKTIDTIFNKQPRHFSVAPTGIGGRMIAKLAVTLLLVGAALLVAVPAKAQSVVLLMTNANIYVAANYNNSYTNSQLRVVPTGVGVTPVTLSVSGLPTGATIAFSTNGYATTANPIGFTNSWNMFYSVAVTNVAKGVYPLTFTCSGAAAASATVNLIVGTLWTNSTPAGNVKWSTGANWSTGVSPGAGDDVMFQDAGNTNHMDGSVTVNTLTFLPLQNATNQNMLIGSGQTLTVVGNGLAVNNDSVTANNKTYTLNIYGAGASLVVTNPAADFTINADNTGAAGSTVTMTNLDNFSATVNRFGLGDWTMAKQGGVGAQQVIVSLAKTNVIKALFPGDYALTNLAPKFSVSLLQNGDPFNNGSASTINLGLSNVIYAESLGYAQNRAGAVNSFRFNPVLTNGVLGVPYALFRNTNGARMNLVGVGIDSGTANPGSNARGLMSFAGGNVDMLVDTMWLGRDRAMSGTTNSGAVGLGVLTFTGGRVDVNFLRAGYQAYTNNSSAQGQINVGGSGITVATLSVNTNLELGFTAGDVNATPGASAALGNGQVTINTNGIVRANKVTVGTLSANNFITINNGGLLDLTNTIASTNKSLTGFTSVGGKLTLHISSTNPVIYVTNLTATGVNAISLASISGIASYPVTIPVISYVNGAAASFSGGTAPGGVNISVNNNVANKTIDITLTTGTPKSLIWKGYVDNNWDVTTTNWLDVATGNPTNFATGDSVIFNDTAAYSTVNVAVDVVPRQSVLPVGMAMTNNTLAYTFTGSGGILGSALFTKSGTNSVEVDSHTEVTMFLNQGTLQGSGDIGSVTVASGTVMNFSGIVKSGVTCAGLLVNSGTIQTLLTVQSGGVATNLNTVDGVLTLDSGSYMYSSGNLNNIGSATVATNATLVNTGVINKGSLTVGGTFNDNSGLSNFGLTGTLTIVGGGLFIPGGDGIGATAVNHIGAGLFPGRVLLAQNSKTIFKLDIVGASHTTLYSSFQDFGVSSSIRNQTGCTLVLTNTTGTYAAGQTFKLFGNADNYLNINATGQGTNTYPVISPASPGAGLDWDLCHLWPSGVIGVISSASRPTLTNSFTVDSGTNIIGQFSWDTSNCYYRLQCLVTTLDVGLSASNWTTIAGSWTNSSVTLTNPIGTNCVFYRISFP